MDHLHPRDQEPIVHHQGVFYKQIGFWTAAAILVSIGAGILGIPYAIKGIGPLLGAIYIISLGLLMMGLHLLLAEVSIQTGKPLQLAGLAQEYLGSWAKWLMTTVVYVMLLGVQVIYMIGVGKSLAALFDSSAFFWSIFFFTVMFFPLSIGMRIIKTIGFFLSIGTIFVVFLMIVTGTPHIDVSHFSHVDYTSLFLPYGVILFAFHGTNAIPEVYSTLRNKAQVFRRAVIFSSLLGIVIYTLFAVVVVGVTGQGTTEIATIGLGEKVGPVMVLFGNLFALLAMSMGYLIVGMSIKDSLRWDFRISHHLALFITVVIPLALFIAGVRQFIATINFVGGVFASIEMILIVLIYLKAKKRGHVPHGSWLNHALWLVVLLLLAFSFGTVYSIVTLF